MRQRNSTKKYPKTKGDFSMKTGDKVLYNGEESVIIVEYDDYYVYINTVIDSMVGKSDLILLESAE